MHVADFERLVSSATTTSVATSTGAVVAAHIFGKASNPAVVLVHGGVGSWNHWAPTIPELSVDFHVIALDLPGCGDSTLPRTFTAGAVLDLDDLDVLVTSIVEAIEQLVPDPQPFGLAGFSFGGIVSGRAAARLGSRLAMLAVIGAGGLGLAAVQDTPPLRAVPANGTWPERAAAHRHNLAALMIADEQRVDDLAVLLHEANVTRSRFRYGDLPSSTALIEELGSISAPLLWITGERDRLSAGFRASGRQMVQAIRPDVDFVEVPGAGHWAAYERDDVVSPLLVERFTAILRPGPAGES